mmetsp:Transcript_85575/g.261743  ORF Transcript_85575/g.261743 Transcript_85575/m.261743 type:complete len:339 (-) Transcript_85575:1458-2474(-)
MPSQDLVRLAALRLERSVARRRETPHAFNHLLAYPHRRHQWLRVLAKDETKVDVEEATIASHHDIVQMPVTDPEDVRDDAITSTTSDEILQYLRLDAVRVLGAVLTRSDTRVRVVRPEELLNVTVVILDDRRNVGRVLDKFDHAIHRRKRHHLVRSELQVDAIPLQDTVHQYDELQNKLVLPQVVALFDHYFFGAPLGVLAAQRAHLAREHRGVHGGLEQRAPLGVYAPQHETRVHGQRDALVQTSDQIEGQLGPGGLFAQRLPKTLHLLLGALALRGLGAPQAPQKLSPQGHLAVQHPPDAPALGRLIEDLEDPLPYSVERGAALSVIGLRNEVPMQ